MKKYFGLGICLVFLFLLTGCMRSAKISLPEAEIITKVQIKDNQTQQLIEIKDVTLITDMLHTLRYDTRKTWRESVNDQPVGISEYYTIEFFYEASDESSSLLYLYQRSGRVYIEQPYAGIWKMSYKGWSKFGEILSK